MFLHAYNPDDKAVVSLIGAAALGQYLSAEDVETSAAQAEVRATEVNLKAVKMEKSTRALLIGGSVVLAAALGWAFLRTGKRVRRTIGKRARGR